METNVDVWVMEKFLWQFCYWWQMKGQSVSTRAWFRSGRRSRDMKFCNQAFRESWDAYAAELMNMSETSPFKWFEMSAFTDRLDTVLEFDGLNYPNLYCSNVFPQCKSQWCLVGLIDHKIELMAVSWNFI